jgi:8-oxo-dGTP pyrophosphatase MutT (NUDIX family)
MPDDQLRPAATILLLRDTSALEVLMIARADYVGFAGGALVFPGGKVEESDADPAWREHAPGLSGDPIVGAGQIAAIREAFEETGLILAYGADGCIVDDSVAATLAAARPEVEANDSIFRSLIADHGLKLAVDRLQLFAHWTPPLRVHKRYDTLFFIARAPERQTVREDGYEATEAIWTTPAAALDARIAGVRKVMFPTAANLSLLGLAANVDDACARARARPIRRVTPELQTADGEAFLVIPEDLGYPVTREDVRLSSF